MAQLWFITPLYLEHIARESSSDIMGRFGSYGRHRVTRDIGKKTVEKCKTVGLTRLLVLIAYPEG
jgi:hypothetical protein